MNISHISIFGAFFLLLSNSALAYRIYPYPYEQYQESIPVVRMIMIVPTKSDITWPEYILPPLEQDSDERIRRGWGSGRRRRFTVY